MGYGGGGRTRVTQEFGAPTDERRPAERRRVKTRRKNKINNSFDIISYRVLKSIISPTRNRGNEFSN